MTAVTTHERTASNGDGPFDEQMTRAGLPEASSTGYQSQTDEAGR
jgi:hypothetical protein